MAQVLFRTHPSPPPTGEHFSWPTPKASWEDVAVRLGQWLSWDSNHSLQAGRCPSCPVIDKPAVFYFPPNSPGGLVRLSSGPLAVSARLKLAQAPRACCLPDRGVGDGGGGKAEGPQGTPSHHHLEIGFETPSPWKLLAAGSAHFTGCVGASQSPDFQSTWDQTPWPSSNIPEQEAKGWGTEGAEQYSASGPCVASGN